MFEFIVYIRAIAILLITNSHCDNIYPISVLATGGAIGNALFFFVSGYCLANIKVNFFRWYKHRLIRIYPSVLILGLFLLIIGEIHITSWLDFVYNFIWPIKYWFIAAIILMYIPFYFIFKQANTKIIFIVLTALIALYGFGYTKLDTSQFIIEQYMWFKSIFYFIVMITGGLYRNAYEEKKEIFLTQIKGITSFAAAIVSFVMFYGYKVICNKIHICMHLQFFIHVFLILFVLFFFFGMRFYEKTFIALTKTLAGKIAFQLSQITLEMFLMQTFIAEFIKNKNILFPISFIIYAVVTLAGGKFLNLTTSVIIKALKNHKLKHFETV